MKLSRPLRMFAAFVAVVALQFTFATDTTAKEEEAVPTKNALFLHPGFANRPPQHQLVELVREGKIVVSREVQSGRKATFSVLDSGSYEVHLSAPKFAKAVYKIQITDSAPTVLHTTIDAKEPILIGGGVSIAEILRRIDELQKANEKLQSRVNTLEAEISALKAGNQPAEQDGGGKRE